MNQKFFALAAFAAVTTTSGFAADAPAKKPVTKPAATTKAIVKTKQTAKDLVDDLQKEAAFIAAMAKANTSGKIDPKAKEQRPFFSGLKGMVTTVEAMQKSLAAKDDKFFKQLDDAGKSFASIESGWQMMRAPDAKVTAGVKALGVTFNELRTHYGKLAAREKKGGALTAAETKELVKIQADAKAMLPKLQALKAKAVKEKNVRLVAQLTDLVKSTERAAKAEKPSVNAYVTTLELVAWTSFEWYAVGEVLEVWEPAIYTEWTSYDTTFSGYYASYATVSESYSYDWSYAESSYAVVDASAEYNVDISASAYASSESFAESYSEENATEEMTSEEVASEEADTESYEEDTVDADDDADGDGVENADDDDNGSMDDEDSGDDDSADDDGGDDGGSMDDSGDDDGGDDSSDDDGGSDDDSGGGSSNDGGGDE